MKTRKHHFDRVRFEEVMGFRWIISHCRGGVHYTYIAKSKFSDVYKIGRTRNPLQREKTFSGEYGGFKFKMMFFLKGDIELQLLYALYCAGAKTPLPESLTSKPREAYYMNKEDIDYIVDKFGFRPISEFTLKTISE